MPFYIYLCDCGHRYEEYHAISESHPELCPRCNLKYGDGFSQDFSSYQTIGLMKDAPTTVGQQAELNAKRLGKEQCQLLAEKYRKPINEFTGRLPPSAKIHKSDDSQDEIKDPPKSLNLNNHQAVEKYIYTGEV